MKFSFCDFIYLRYFISSSENGKEKQTKIYRILTTKW